MAPRRGFKPRTLALTVRCSITELTRNFSIIILTLPLSVLSRIAVSYKLVGEADNHTSAFWLKRQAYYSYTISRENIWPLRLAYVYARLMTKRITAFRISPQVANQTFFLVGVEGFEPPRLSHLLPKQTRYQATVYTPICATRCYVIIYQLIAYMIAVCAAV